MSAAFHTADHSFLLETHSLHDFQNTHSPEFLLSSQTILCQGGSLTLGISREKSSNTGIDCKCTGKTGGARRRKCSCSTSQKLLTPLPRAEEEQYRRPRVSPAEIPVGVLPCTRRAQEPASQVTETQCCCWCPVAYRSVEGASPISTCPRSTPSPSGRIRSHMTGGS